MQVFTELGTFMGLVRYLMKQFLCRKNSLWHKFRQRLGKFGRSATRQGKYLKSQGKSDGRYKIRDTAKTVDISIRDCIFF